MAERSLVTLSEKKVVNCSAIDKMEERFGRAGTADRCSKVLMVFQSWRGFELFVVMSGVWYIFLAARMALW